MGQQLAAQRKSVTTYEYVFLHHEDMIGDKDEYQLMSLQATVTEEMLCVMVGMEAVPGSKIPLGATTTRNLL